MGWYVIGTRPGHWLILGSWNCRLFIGSGLQLLIGFFAVWIAFRMFKGAHYQVDPNQKLPSAALQLAAGGGIGWHRPYSGLVAAV